MEEEKFSFKGTFQKSKEFVETQIDLIRLQTIEKVSRLAGSFVTDASKLLLALFIVFFLCMALGFWLGELLGSYSLGFLSTAGIFLLIIIIISFIEPQLDKFFMNFIIKRFMAKWHQAEELDNDEEEEKIYEERRKKAKEAHAQLIKQELEERNQILEEKLNESDTRE